jgi:ribosomal protein S18 acetylase RimI-like enzyme
MRTARSWTSGENFGDFLMMAPFSIEGASSKTGAVHYPTFCSVEAKPIYALYDLFVLPSARKSGVGRMLLQAAEAQAAKAGKVRMDLTTAKTNKAAQSLYESLGWVRDDVFFAYNRRVARP